jgi:hypothetical protein
MGFEPSGVARQTRRAVHWLKGRCSRTEDGGLACTRRQAGEAASKVVKRGRERDARAAAAVVSCERDAQAAAASAVLERRRRLSAASAMLKQRPRALCSSGGGGCRLRARCSSSGRERDARARSRPRCLPTGSRARLPVARPQRPAPGRPKARCLVRPARGRRRVTGPGLDACRLGRGRACPWCDRSGLPPDGLRHAALCGRRGGGGG